MQQQPSSDIHNRTLGEVFSNRVEEVDRSPHIKNTSPQRLIQEIKNPTEDTKVKITCLQGVKRIKEI